MNIFSNIKLWWTSLYRVWRRELYLVFTDPGVMLFFFALPTVYPIVYTLIYNPELVREIPVVVVDSSRTAASREFTRTVNQTEAINVIGYAANLNEAREAMNSHECFGIMEIPADYAERLGRGEQAIVPFYSEMSLLIRYRSFVSALTDVQIATGARVQGEVLDAGGLITQAKAMQGSPINSEANFMGDPTQGFASFVIPGIIVLILQQSLILGITMLAGGIHERRRRNRGVDPMLIDDAPVSSFIMGKTLCYLTLYIPLAYYTLCLVPDMFSLPHVGDYMEYISYILPMLVATSMLGICLGVFVTERESSMLVIVFTSVIFLFLSGLTWPRYAMSPFWTLVGDLVPATWGMEGFIRLNGDHASVYQQTDGYRKMWGLTLLYFIGAWFLVRNYFKLQRSARLRNGNKTVAATLGD